MKERLKGLITGLILGVAVVGGTVFAATGLKTIEVSYDNIKIYKDNVLCELKDANGNVVEPFIYNGTTYLPVRGTAGLADMEVSWDGATKSVYLWDELVPEGTYLMDVCPPYQSNRLTEYTSENRKSFKMAGKEYSNGFTVNDDEAFALFNLDSKYSEISLTIGHVDGTSMNDRKVYFYLDEELVKEITVKAEGLSQKISIPVKYGLQLKIVADNVSGNTRTGFGNIEIH